MGKIKSVGAGWGILLALVFAAPATARPSAAEDPLLRWRPYVEEASRRFGVPAPWIERVMIAESGGRTEIGGRATVSTAGAMGLMQLMPGTWAEIRRRLGLGADPHAPRDNILAGTYYLRLMHDRFGYPGLFGAYNAGPARYAAYLGGKQRLPAETRAYLGKVADIAPPVALARNSGKGESGSLPDSGVSDGNTAKSLFFIRR